MGSNPTLITFLSFLDIFCCCAVVSEHFEIVRRRIGGDLRFVEDDLCKLDRREGGWLGWASGDVADRAT